MRRFGVTRPVLILGYTPAACAEILAREDFSQCVYSAEYGRQLSAAAVAADVAVKVHIKLDTGMGRLGFRVPGEGEDSVEGAIAVCRLPALIAEGVFTHFATADEGVGGDDLFHQQGDRYIEALNAFSAAGITFAIRHCANSAALLKLPETAMDAVRVGSAILGRVACRSDLKRVGVCHTNLEEVRWLPKGHTCGYGAAWKAKKPTQIGVIPVGWYHGFATQYGDDVFRFRDSARKILSGVKQMLLPPRITVTVDGVTCRVLGHVGMLHTVVDITDKNLSQGAAVTMEINPCRVRGMEIRYI